MEETIFAYEPFIRFGFFVSILSVMMLWELRSPRRSQHYKRLQRWPQNLFLMLVGTPLVRLVFPVVAIGAAFIAAERGWGLFNVLTIPAWLALVIAVLALDLVIYLQHRLFHAVPWFWRLHRMHHADLEFDVTTGLRFHPFEIILSMAIKIATVVVLGASPLAVLIFEVLLNATAMFNHGNIRLSDWLDRRLRLFVVTPDMHRVHHSIVREETDSNFGFNLPWWDRLFGTYRDQPAAGQLNMTIGVDEFRQDSDLRLGRMLLQLFRSDKK